ncbi:MAG: large conductance mechanosensitive channel protein MscL [Microbacteriaceae bacterium]
MLKGFREFLMRGNVIDLAVAVVIGAAFTSVVNAVVNGVMNPLIGSVFKADSLDNALDVTIPFSGAVIQFGLVLGALINFVIVAIVVYFVFVLPVNVLRNRSKAAETTEEPAETEVSVLVEIRDLLKRQD